MKKEKYSQMHFLVIDSSVTIYLKCTYLLVNQTFVNICIPTYRLTHVTSVALSVLPWSQITAPGFCCV